MEGNEDSAIRLRIKNSKSGQEILLEYSPFKEAIAEIDACLKEEMRKIQESGRDGDEDTAANSSPVFSAASAAGSAIVAASAGAPPENLSDEQAGISRIN